MLDRTQPRGKTGLRSRCPPGDNNGLLKVFTRTGVNHFVQQDPQSSLIFYGEISVSVCCLGQCQSASVLTLLTLRRSAAERARHSRIMYMSRPGILSRSMAFPMNAEAMT